MTRAKRLAIKRLVEKSGVVVIEKTWSKLRKANIIDYVLHLTLDQDHEVNFRSVAPDLQTACP